MMVLPSLVRGSFRPVVTWVLAPTQVGKVALGGMEMGPVRLVQ